MPAAQNVTAAEVMDAFAVEPTHDRATLERYLRTYPQFASGLCLLSFELNRTDVAEETASPSDERLVAKAWSRRVSEAVQTANPLADLLPLERAAVARDLGIKVQIMSMFREARIDLATVPARFIGAFAERLKVGVDALLGGLTIAPPATAQAFKADDRPSAERGVDFARALRDSGATDEEVSALLEEI